VAKIKVKTFAIIGKRKDIGRKIASRERIAKERKNKGIMLTMEK